MYSTRSDFGAASSAVQLREHGITRRLNVAREAVGRLPKDDGIPTMDVPMQDVFDENCAQEMISTWVTQLHEAMSQLRAWREEGAVVNVSCQMGKNRSGAVCLAWLCSECGWKLDEAASHLRRITALACANPHIVKAVADLLGVSTMVPLNPAGDGGGWVCISPPGTPRQGGTAAFENQAKQALERLARDAEPSSTETAEGGVHGSSLVSGAACPDSDDEGVVPLFAEDDLSDVD